MRPGDIVMAKNPLVAEIQNYSRPILVLHVFSPTDPESFPSYDLGPFFKGLMSNGEIGLFAISAYEVIS